MSAFVYKWTNIIDGKWYIGSRTAKNCHIDDGYICSSKILKPIIKQNPDQWHRSILAIGTATDMKNLERNLLKLYNAKCDPQSYNQTNGAPTGGRKKGISSKIPANAILDAIKKHTGKSFFEILVNNYMTCVHNDDYKLVNDYHKMFDKKGIRIMYNGEIVYEPR